MQTEAYTHTYVKLVEIWSALHSYTITLKLMSKCLWQNIYIQHLKSTEEKKLLNLYRRAYTSTKKRVNLFVRPRLDHSLHTQMYCMCARKEIKCFFFSLSPSLSSCSFNIIWTLLCIHNNIIIYLPRTKFIALQFVKCKTYILFYNVMFVNSKIIISLNMLDIIMNELQ